MGRGCLPPIYAEGRLSRSQAVDVLFFPVAKNFCTQKFIWNLVILIKPNLDCNYTFPIDLAPNGLPFVANSVGKL